MQHLKTNSYNKNVKNFENVNLRKNSKDFESRKIHCKFLEMMCKNKLSFELCNKNILRNFLKYLDLE